MKPGPSQAHSLRRKRGVAWLDICAILTMLGIMAALSWMGWQRSQIADSPKFKDKAGNPSAVADP